MFLTPCSRIHTRLSGTLHTGAPSNRVVIGVWGVRMYLRHRAVEFTRDFLTPYTDCNRPHCNTLQHTATHCNTLQHTATHCNRRGRMAASGTLMTCDAHYNTHFPQVCPVFIGSSATHCNTLQHTATHCNTLQHTATHCNTLQHTATGVVGWRHQ